MSKGFLLISKADRVLCTRTTHSLLISSPPPRSSARFVSHSSRPHTLSGVKRRRRRRQRPSEWLCPSLLTQNGKEKKGGKEGKRRHTRGHEEKHLGIFFFSGVGFLGKISQIGFSRLPDAHIFASLTGTKHLKPGKKDSHFSGSRQLCSNSRDVRVFENSRHSSEEERRRLKPALRRVSL